MKYRPSSRLKFDYDYEPISLIYTIYIYTILLLKSVGVRKLQVAILARSSREM